MSRFFSASRPAPNRGGKPRFRAFWRLLVPPRRGGFARLDAERTPKSRPPPPPPAALDAPETNPADGFRRKQKRLGPGHRRQKFFSAPAKPEFAEMRLRTNARTPKQRGPPRPGGSFPPDPTPIGSPPVDAHAPLASTTRLVAGTMTDDHTSGRTPEYRAPVVKIRPDRPVGG